MAIGLLTAGGDCPGLNAAIRGVVTRADAAGVEVLGVEAGWEGLMAGRTRALTRDDVRGIVGRGGTILGTSRLDPYVHGEGHASIAPTVSKVGIETLVVIGGDGSLRTAARLAEAGLAVVGIPKTIDNDVSATDVSLGFHTAVQIVVDAIDRLTTTAESHNRIMVVEVMGRTAGWIATYAGMAGGAEAILVPEAPVDLDDLCTRLTARHDGGAAYSVVVVAEGSRGPDGALATQGADQFGFERLGGVGNEVAVALERLTGFETRVTTLGYLQRGGTPTAFDRILGTRFGVGAVELAMEGRSGVMVALRGDEIVATDLDEATAMPRPLRADRLATATWFFA